MLRTPLGRASRAPVKGAKKGMPDSITLGSMALIMGVPMQLKRANVLLSAIKASTLATARLTS